MSLFGFAVLLSCIFCLEALKYGDFKSGILPPIDSCGRQHVDEDLTTRAGAKVEAYPWMVYVPQEQRRPINPDPKFRCAGSLISKRYFVTTLYCLEYYLRNVYIGQHDTSKNDTCGAFGCKPVQEVKVDRWVADFEIALIRLDKEVDFSEYVQPICLPFEDFPKAETGETVYSSGWGRMYPGGDYSKTKKNIKQTLISDEECKASGVEIPAEAKLVCTKVNHEDVTNIPCFGDGGAPIMHRTPQKQWVLQGILPHLPQCVINGPGRGARIDEEVLQFMLKHMYD